MNDPTMRALVVLAFIATMPLIALLAVQVARARAVKRTKAVAAGATDAAAKDWAGAPMNVTTPQDPTEAIPLADWSEPTDPMGVATETVFGSTYLPTRPPERKRGRHRA